MVKLVAYAEFKARLESAKALEGELLPNELEMLHSLTSKYGEPLDPDPFDVTALEVIQRNVGVRKGFSFDMKKDPKQYVNLSKKKEYLPVVKAFKKKMANKLAAIRENDLKKKK